MANPKWRVPNGTISFRAISGRLRISSISSLASEPALMTTTWAATSSLLKVGPGTSTRFSLEQLFNSELMNNIIWPLVLGQASSSAPNSLIATPTGTPAAVESIDRPPASRQFAGSLARTLWQRAKCARQKCNQTFACADSKSTELIQQD